MCITVAWETATPSRNTQLHLTHLLWSWNKWYGEKFFFPPVSKGCPFAFSTADRLDFFFLQSLPKLCVLLYYCFSPRSPRYDAGPRFKKKKKKKKKRAMPFNFCPQFVQFTVCCRGQIPVSLSDSTLPSSALTLKDKIWSWDLILSIKLRLWSHSIQNAINHIF